MRSRWHRTLQPRSRQLTEPAPLEAQNGLLAGILRASGARLTPYGRASKIIPFRPSRMRTYVRYANRPTAPVVIETDDLIVLLLGAPGPPGQPSGRIDGITRLEKLVFLIEKERKPTWLTEDAEFESHNFGPFSSKIYTAVDTLVAANLLRDSESTAASTEDAWETENIIGQRASDPYATRNFELTDRGQRYYKALLSELPDGVENDLSEFKQRFAALPLRQLVRYVYERHPKYTDKSIIRDDVLY
jgi:uncharacterized protein